MSSSSLQLIDPRFQKCLQKAFWSEKKPSNRFVVKLHHAHILHFDLRLEMYGRLFSLEVDDLHACFKHPIKALHRSDQDLSGLLTERRIIPSDHQTDPIIVWDHGTYSLSSGSGEEALDQIQRGCIEVDLHGIRLNGRFRIQRSQSEWSMECLSIRSLPYRSMQSVLSGKSLYQDFSQRPSRTDSFCLWLEWSDYYTDQTELPQIVVLQGKVIDLNIAAAEKNIHPGMSLQHALPLVENCQVKEFRPDPARQSAWLKHLLPYTDVIQPVTENSAVIDLSKHPDPNYVAGKLLTKLCNQPFGYLHYGAGPSLWIAKLAAEQNRPYDFADNTQYKIASLPVENFICFPLEDRNRLKALGFKTIGEVSEVDPSKLASQFGERASVMKMAAQGRAIERVQPMFPPQAVIETLRFDAPINDSLSLADATRKMALELTKKIKGQQSGLAVLTAESEDGSEHTVKRPYNRPLHTLDRIRASLAYLVEELQKDFPNIIRLTVRLDHLEPLKSSQQDLFISNPSTDTHAALASIKSAFGKQSVSLASEIERPRREQVLKAWRNATGWN